MDNNNNQSLHEYLMAYLCILLSKWPWNVETAVKGFYFGSIQKTSQYCCHTMPEYS